GGALNSDADQLSRLTGVPAIIWVGIFLVVTVGALGIGASWLLSGLLAR
nr:M50 family metallopeptidase [Geodermatophilaceae bacterium]